MLCDILILQASTGPHTEVCLFGTLEVVAFLKKVFPFRKISITSCFTTLICGIHNCDYSHDLYKRTFLFPKHFNTLPLLNGVL